MTNHDIAVEVATLVENGLSMARAIRAVARANMMAYGTVEAIVDPYIEYSWPSRLALGVSFA